MKVLPNIAYFSSAKSYNQGDVVRYKMNVDGVPVTYYLRCKFNIPAQPFNPVHFENTTPKKWKVVGPGNFSVMPGDTLIFNNSRVVNNSLGYMTRAEADAINPANEKSESSTQVWINGVDRRYLIEMYPKVNDNHPEIKYSWRDTTREATVVVEDVIDNVLISFRTKEVAYNLYEQHISRLQVRFYGTFISNPTPDFSGTGYVGYYLNNSLNALTRFRLIKAGGIKLVKL